MTQSKHAVFVLASYLPVALVRAGTMLPDRITLFQLFSTLLALVRSLGREGDHETACAASCPSCQ